MIELYALNLVVVHWSHTECRLSVNDGNNTLQQFSIQFTSRHVIVATKTKVNKNIK